VYDLERAGEAERHAPFTEIDNRKLLWHGTDVAVAAAIVSSGLRIMPGAGGRVGRGIYLADEMNKSVSLAVDLVRPLL
jgi:poly [ADP-ribose] polymerase